MSDRARTQYYTASSLDGYIADDRNSVDWLSQFGDGGTDDYSDFIRNVGAVVMGSTTYEWILDQHVYPAAGPNQPWPYSQPAWVFSTRSLRPVESANIRFVQGDVRPVHVEMSAAVAGKNIWLIGGGALAGQFHDAGLLDEVIVTFAPVTLGAGAPLLPREITSPPFRLISVAKLGETFAQLRYEVQSSS